MNGFFGHFLTYLPIIPAAVMCCVPMANRFRFSRIRTYIDMIAVLTFSCVVISWLDYATEIRTPPLSILLFLICFIAYHTHLTVHISKSLAVFAVVVAFMSILSSFSTAIDAFFNPWAGEEYITPLYIVVQLVVSSLSALIFFFPLKKYGRELVDRLDIPRVWYALIPNPLVCTTVNLVMNPDEYNSLFMNHAFRSYIIVLITLTLALITGVLSFYHTVIGILNAERQHRQLSLLELQESQFRLQQKYIEESATERHDFKQIMYTLNGLLQAEDYDGLREYFSAYFSNMSDNPVRKFCLNQPLNALLNYYAGEAQEAQIDLRWVIDPLDDVNIPDVDLCTVIGNILDNAVAACRDSEPADRFIQLSAVVDNGTTLFIVASNSCEGLTFTREGRYVSTKMEGSGLGLSSITQIAESYGGSAEFSDRDGVFYTNVMIPLSRTSDQES